MYKSYCKNFLIRFAAKKQSNVFDAQHWNTKSDMYLQLQRRRYPEKLQPKM